MRGWTKGVTLGFVALALSGCFGEDEAAKGPKKDFILVRNDSSTEANIRIKFWQKDFLKVAAGEKAKLEFVADSNTVQVEARSRKQWDECWVTMQKGQTLVVFDERERIGCSAE